MSFEKNRNALNKALRQMKGYDPPANLWDNIEKDLAKDTPEDEATLGDAIRRLPEYAPPAQVWNSLAKSLDQEKQAKRISLKTRMRYMSIAASLALVLGTAFWLMQEPGPSITKQYAEENMQQFDIEIDWLEDEGSFDKLSEQLAQLNDPTLNKLQIELKELSSARNDVEQMLKSYGKDPKLLNQLGDIERSRSDIYRQIIDLI